MRLNKAILKFALAICAALCVLNSEAQGIDTIKSGGYGFPAEANTALKYHYELPVTVLNYKSQLGLTDAQVAKLKSIDATLKLKKIETAVSAKRNEHMLDSLFKSSRLNEGVIIFYTNRYGLYEGEYRGAVLLACYNTRKILTPQQIAKLATLTNHN